MPLQQQLYFLVFNKLPIITYGISKLLRQKYPLCELKEINNTAFLFSGSNNLPDKAIVILCIQFNELNDLKPAGLNKDFFEKYHVIIFTTQKEAVHASQYFRIGIKGFVPTEGNIDELLIAIEDIIDGKIYVSKTLLNIISSEMVAEEKSNPFNALTEREFMIMKLFIKGLRIKTIAEQLNLHSSTIGTFKTKIFTKLRVKNVIELKEAAVENGIDIS